MQHHHEIKKTKETADRHGDRLVAIARVLTYAADEAKKTGIPFVAYCVNLARDSVIAEMRERGLTIATEGADSPPVDRAAIGGR